MNAFNYFDGSVYFKADTAAADAARRLETKTKKLKSAFVQVTTHDQLFGDSSGQTYTVAAGSSLTFNDLDISTLYFKNATAGQNGTVTVIGTLA